MAASNIAVEWMKQDVSFNSTGFNDTPSLTTDADGNILFVYLTGGTTSGNTYLGNNDIVICKMNASGKVIWIKQDGRFNTAYNDNYPKITTDSDNNVYVCYESNGTVSGGAQILFTYIVIIKLNSDGEVLWFNQSDEVNSTNSNTNPSIAVDINQNVYVAYQGLGTTSGNVSVGVNDTIITKLDSVGNVLWVEQRPDINVVSVDLRPEIRMCNDNRYFYLTFYQIINQTASPFRDIKIVKYDTLSRTLVWNKGTEISTPADDYFSTLAIDQNDNVYLSYKTLGASSGNTYIGPNFDIVVTKMSSLDGSTQWLTQIPTIENETNPSIVYDNVNDNLFMLFNRLNISTGIIEIVIQKLNKDNGVLEWEEINETINGSITTNKFLSNDSSSTRIISADNQGNIIFTFYTRGVIPGGSISNFANTTDIILMKLDSQGNIQWIKQDATLNTSGADSSPSLTSSSSSVYLSYSSNGYVTTSDIQPSTGSINWKNNGSSVNPPVGIQSAITSGGSSSATDINGNVYVTYFTIGTVSSGSQAGVTDIALYKLDTNGNIVWVTQSLSYNTSQQDVNSSIALDLSGNVYIAFIPGGSPLVIRVSKFDQLTGNFQGNVDIPVTNITSIDTTVKPDIVGKNNGFYVSYVTGTPRRPILQSYDSSLIQLWIYTVPGVYNVDSKVSIVAASTNIYLSYSTFGRSSGQSNIGGQDIVIAKIIDNTSSASLSWVRQQPAFNTTRNDYYSKIAIDSSQNIYVVYNTEGTTSGATTNTIAQIALASYDTNGTYRWIIQTPLNPIDAIADQYPTLCILNDELFVSYATRGTVSGGINIQGPQNNVVIVKFRMPIPRINITSARVGSSFLALENTQLLSNVGIDNMIETPDTFDFTDSANYIQWGNAYGGNGVTAGSLFRDLKRTVTVSGSNGNYLYKFRKVQLVNGIGTEGVGGSSSDIDAYRCGWICTWSAYGNGNA